MKRWQMTGCCFFLVVATATAHADEDWKLLDREIPDVTITLPGTGRRSLLDFCREKPTMISLVYSQCVGICYPFLYELRDKVSGIGGVPGDYRMLILSFDKKETEESMMGMADLAGLRNNPQWDFGIIEPNDILRLAQAIGFQFKVDSATDQIDHPPIVVGVDSKGRIVSIVKKFEMSRDDLWQIYREIRGEYVPLAREGNDRLVSCFSYDPRQGRVRFDWGMLLLYTPALLGGVAVWRIFRSGRSARGCVGGATAGTAHQESSPGDSPGLPHRWTFWLAKRTSL